MTVHFEVSERACGCGDSFCSEDYETVERIACGAAVSSSKSKSQFPGHVTCPKCQKTKEFKTAMGSGRMTDSSGFVIDVGHDPSRRAARPILPLDEAIDKYGEAKKAWEAACARIKEAEQAEVAAAQRLNDARKDVETAARG